MLVDEKKRDVCLRLAFEIPLANFAGLVVALIIGGAFHDYNPGLWAGTDLFLMLWPWFSLASCIVLLIVARPHWGYYVLFVPYIFLVHNLCLWPLMYWR